MPILPEVGRIGRLKRSFRARSPRLYRTARSAYHAPDRIRVPRFVRRIGLANVASALGLSPRIGRLAHHAPRALRPPGAVVLRAGPRPPSISLVTPSFEQGAFLERTLRSVLDQDYPALEYVVQDGGSRDGTPAVLARHAARLHHVASAPDGGQADAINQGFAHTSGEIMGWLNSDDRLLPGSLAYVANHFASHPEIDVIYGHRVLIDERDREIGRWILPEHDDDVLRWVDFVPQEALFWRRRAWEKAGGALDVGFRFALDWDLLLRFQEAGMRMARVPRFLGAFRVHPTQKTSAWQDVGKDEVDRLRARTLGFVPDSAQVKRRIRGYLMRHVVLHGLHRARLVRF